MKKSTSIVLFGTYAEENCGDDLLLVSQIITLRRRISDVSITIFTGDCGITRSLLINEEISLKNIKLVYTGRKGLREPGKSFLQSFSWFFRNLKEIYHGDLLLIGPGNQLQDVTRRFRIVFFLSRGWLAWMFRTPFAIIGIGYYQLNSIITKRLLRLTGNVSCFFSTRDAGGAEKVIETGVRKDKVFPLADISFTYPWQETNLVEQGRKKPLIGFTSRIFLPQVFPLEQSLNFEKCYAWLLSEIHRKIDAEFIFFPYYITAPWKDTLSLERLKELSGNIDLPVKVYHYKTLAELSDKITTCDAMIGVRYHSILMAVQKKVPVMGISYAFKTERFMNENGLSDYTVKLEDVNRENLSFMFDNLWTHRNTLKKDYQGIIDRERALAKQHFDLICHTLREKKAV